MGEVRETGGKVLEGKATVAQVSQDTGGKGDMLTGEREREREREREKEREREIERARERDREKERER